MNVSAARAVAAITLTFALAVGCSRGSEPKRSTAPSPHADIKAPDWVPHARNVDTQHPERDSATIQGVIPIRASDRVAAGTPITTTFLTTPDSSCQLRVSYESGGPTTALRTVVADRRGFVSWDWVPRAGTSGDTATALVVCSGGEQGTTKIVID